MPGGPDLEIAYNEIKSAKEDIRAFVRGGGRYLGICLDMYLAGYSPGIGLLPKGADTDSEGEQKSAQVRTDEDAIIQIDYTYSHGLNAGQTHKGQWIFFQEGPFVNDFANSDTSRILAKYSSTGHVAATLSKYGSGWVGLIGPHPEADQTWFDAYNLPAPQGLRYDIGYDLIQALMSGRAMLPSEEVEISSSTKGSYISGQNSGQRRILNSLSDKSQGAH